MKKLFSSSYVRTLLLLITNIFAIEIIFKLISSSNVLSFSTLRILTSTIIISGILAYLISFCNNIFRKILTSILVFLCAFYSCVQAGFYNFLGVYMSVQTSSQLGAVVDYIREFALSFKWYYFLTFIPFILLTIYFIFFDKEALEKVSLKIKSFITLGIAVLFSLFYYGTLVIPVFQNIYQPISNNELFLTASNPSIAMEQFGATAYVILDFRSALFPIKIESEVVVENNNNDSSNQTEYSRVFDDTLWNQIIETEKNKSMNSLNQYFINRPITSKNEYTGMFEDKNLIMIMMESVNDIILDPIYYPNFARIMNNGWYWENNYSPRNSCATMNNEFSGMTSLYSIYNTCTASKYKKNTYSESIFHLFKQTDYQTFSAHNYTQAYYPRKTIHRNMGSEEYYGVEKLGISYSNEYRNWANDDDFMKSVLEILDDKNLTEKKFMTWLTTVSSHQPYNVSSDQGDRYLSLTKNTKYPKDVRRYMSKLKVLDEGLGILLDGLENKGILDDTVIVLFGDHYPYGIPTKNLNKVLDYNTAEDLNAERVPFVIYNPSLEHKTFSDYTFYVNMLPTLANLFNIDYDPRLYLGQDLLSEDYESLVVFADGSWKNEIAFYDASKSRIKYYTDKTYTPEEIKKINNDINTKIDVSSRVIKNNYFEYLTKKLKEEKNKKPEVETTTCPIDGKTSDYQES